jgi:hypothetical protein
VRAAAATVKVATGAGVLMPYCDDTQSGSTVGVTAPATTSDRRALIAWQPVDVVSIRTSP